MYTKLEVATKMGYPGVTPGFIKLMSSLGGLGLLEYPKDGTGRKLVTLVDVAFPFGRGGVVDL